MASDEIIQNQREVKVDPFHGFFDETCSILTDRNSLREHDILEAIRRMDIYFSTVPFFRLERNAFYREPPRHYAPSEHITHVGKWDENRKYTCYYRHEHYYDYHDGFEDWHIIRYTIRRISREEYLESIEYGTACVVQPGSKWYIPDSFFKLESGRYITVPHSYGTSNNKKEVVKDFLGISGYFELEYYEQ